MDFEKGNLMILNGKNHDSRMVTVSSSLRAVFLKYKTQATYISDDDFLFHGYHGQQYPYTSVHSIFQDILNEAGITKPSGRHGPRIHDLRHVFAIRSLEQMEEKGYDLYTSLPILCKYMGHKSLTETEYYIKLTKSSYSKIIEAASAYAPKLFPYQEDRDYE